MAGATNNNNNHSNEEVTITFSTPDRFEAFDDIDLEDQGHGGALEKGGGRNSVVAPPPSAFSMHNAPGDVINNAYVPPKLEGEGRRFSGLSMDGSTATGTPQHARRCPLRRSIVF